MAYQFTQTGAEIQDILDQVGTINTLEGSTTSGSVSPASGTWTQVGNVTVDAGTYLIIAGAMWNPNSTGIRAVGFSNASGTTPSGRYNIATSAPMENEYIYTQFVKYYSTNASSSIYVWVRQTSGGSLSCNPYYYVIKLS